MSKCPAILMEHTYPFGAASDPQGQKYLVRKKLNKAQGQLQKTKILASLKHQCLIKLEGLQEENNQYWMMYEYVPQSIQKWFPSVNKEFIENYQQRLILFSRYLADKAIIVTFRREYMGVSQSGDAKYYLDTNFVIDPTIDKLGLKKKYKEEIRQLIQYYIDKKNSMKTQSTKPLPTQKKQNSKVLKILEAIEKGKANLCAQTPKQSALALANSQNSIAQNKNAMKSTKNMNIQNIFIQKQMNKVNKIQVMMGNKPVQVFQEEFKRQYASSSFYLNGVPTMKIEREGQARRLFSPTDKLTRFQEVKYKEYKTMKTSGEVYVQDFISVLEADDAEKLTLPGSPRGTIHGLSPRSSLHSPSKFTAQNSKMLTGPPNKLAIQPQPKRQNKNTEQKHQQIMDKIGSPRNQKIYSQHRPFHSQKQVKNTQKQDSLAKNISINQFKPPSNQINNKTIELQKKVSQAIANSMNAISKFKSAKNNQANN